MKFNYLVVDDEQLARKLILSHASKVETLELTGECSSAIEAANAVRKHKIDLIFLDIQMPELNGLDFLQTLKNPPAIILTTAYRDFAIEAFELDVLDYLLKPISFERFLKATNKFFQSKQPDQVRIDSSTDDTLIYLKADRRIYPVELDEILYIESLDDYVKVYLTNRVLITRENISALEQKLPATLFVRIHRSFIISRKKINSMSSEFVQIAGKDLPFGRAFKQSAMALLKLEK
ncbi:MAG TPA: LytTR family DNA-binding domain-containing protein [Cyclobacteriaceae bacterium]